MKLITNFEKSNQYRSEIHDLIPGGAHTYSKGDDQFPILSPAAIKKGKGAYLWDLDDNKFLDCSMGLTSISLGHAYEPVLKKVREELENGVNFQRPSYLEREMAKRFLSLIPCHDMIKFAKNGSSITTAATKLARAYTGRKLIAFPSDHAFYSYDDWFIGKSVCDRGIPEEIKNLSVTYISTDLNSLEELFKKYPDQIACVISEPEKNLKSLEFSLKDTIDLTHQYGALFIQDEMITGFKTDFPGSITKFDVAPDMATWGKGIANGFSFCALTGKKEVMELGGIRNTGEEKLFLVSTTHGGETHGLAAGIATIDVFLKENVVAHNHGIGNYFIKKIKEVVDNNNMADSFDLVETNWFPMILPKNRKGEYCLKLRTLMMQEMIKRGILFQGVFLPCFSHKKEDIDFLAEALDESLKIIKKALETNIENYLIGGEIKGVFRKYL
jgi:glutamate-1-semialdehyde 2,1-aminomutase